MRKCYTDTITTKQDYSARRDRDVSSSLQTTKLYSMSPVFRMRNSKNSVIEDSEVNSIPHNTMYPFIESNGGHDNHRINHFKPSEQQQLPNIDHSSNSHHKHGLFHEPKFDHSSNSHSSHNFLYEMDQQHNQEETYASLNTSMSQRSLFNTSNQIPTTASGERDNDAILLNENSDEEIVRNASHLGIEKSCRNQVNPSHKFKLLTVRVVSAEERRDIVNHEYTAYIIRIIVENSNSSIDVERRYSDFCKLYDTLQNSESYINNKTNIKFPSKHWAGRLGNWTPSKIWTPDAYEELVHTRTMQLDTWIVDIVSFYNRSMRSRDKQKGSKRNGTSTPYSFDAQNAIYDFLLGVHQAPFQIRTTSILQCTKNQQRNSDTRTEKQINSAEIRNSWSRVDRSINWNNPFLFSLSSAIRQATTTIEYMTQNNENNLLGKNDSSIPLDLLRMAKGLAFLTVAKAGFLLSGKVGSGLVIAKLKENNQEHIDDPNNENSSIGFDFWSRPCAIGTIGLGWGVQLGGDVTHCIIVLTTVEAVRDFCACCSSSVQLGTEMSIAVGPVGRGAQCSITNGDWTVHPAYSYAHSQGLFFGISIESSVISIRHDVNSKFYETKYTTSEESLSLLHVGSCPGAQLLYEALNDALTTTVPTSDFRPSSLSKTNKASFSN